MIEAIAHHCVNRPAEWAWAVLEVFRAKRPKLFLFAVPTAILFVGAALAYVVTR